MLLLSDNKSCSALSGNAATDMPAAHRLVKACLLIESAHKKCYTIYH